MVYLLYTQAFVQDRNPKIVANKLKRPYFSPHVDSYEGDLMFISSDPRYQLHPYLVLININTRFVYLEFLLDKSTASLKNAFDNLFYNGLRMNNLRFDGESAIDNDEMKNFFFKRGVNVFCSSSPYTNKSRIVDRFIRTLRDKYCIVEANYRRSHKKFNYDIQHNLLQQIVAIYNNKYHRGIGMKPVEMDHEKENLYIRFKKLQLKAVQDKQERAGLHNLVAGQPVKIFLDQKKTEETFKKKRGNFNRDANFLQYKNGNAIVKCDNNEIVEIPIYWIKI